MLVEPRRTQVSDLQAISADPGNANLIRTQIDILRSPALARRVVEELGLVNHPGFQPRPGLQRAPAPMATRSSACTPSRSGADEQERIETRRMPEQHGGAAERGALEPDLHLG